MSWRVKDTGRRLYAFMLEVFRASVCQKRPGACLPVQYFVLQADQVTWRIKDAVFWQPCRQGVVQRCPL